MPVSGHVEDYIDGLVEEAAPDTTNDMLLLRDATDGSMKKISPDTIVSGGGGIPASGWIAADVMTYVSADDPTYTMTCVGDFTAKYYAGQRIMLTQVTGGTKYFIITKVAYGAPNTTITIYGGTDYNLENEAISNPYFSTVKAPYGFPLDPLKWTVETKDVNSNSQAGPAQNTWYNLGAVSISIPIGCWEVHYTVCLRSVDETAGVYIIQATLSTANNSESDVDFTTGILISTVSQGVTVVARKWLNLTSKTAYYLNERTASANLATLYAIGTVSPNIIRVVCAYL